jgi:nucleoside phosphorylase
MRERHYDLLVLDIALPERADQPVARDGGITLLKNVIDHEIYNVPKHIVGLTAYDAILKMAGPLFGEDLWFVIQYDPASEAWIEQLQRKVRHILLAERSPTGTPEYVKHMCIVTALVEPELSAVRALPWGWKQFEVPNDPTIYYEGQFLREGRPNTIVAAAASRMGMTAAAVLSMKMIAHFRPKYLAMAGILAGVQGRCELGDIVVADPGWDYGSGKLISRDGAPSFTAAPYQISLNASLSSKLSLMAQDRALLDEIRRAWRGPAPRTNLQMHIGPVASGATVLAEPAVVEAVKQQHRKLIGIEMETYGIFSAAAECPLPQPKAFSIKSVCDFADNDKNDKFQAYAAFTSAVALQMFVERFL